MITLYHPKLDSISSSCDDLPDRERKHLRTLRVSEGEPIRIVNGSGLARLGILTEFNSTSCIVNNLTSSSSNEPNGERVLILGKVTQQSVEQTIEYVVPLGLTELYVVTTEFSQPFTIRKERLERIAEKAMKQCQRACLPRIELGDNNNGMHWNNAIQYIDKIPTQTNRILASKTGNPIKSLHDKTGADWIVAVGPEGGFSKQESDELLLHGFIPVSLGERILRTELAAITLFANLI